MNFDRLRSLLLEQAIRGELVEQQAIDFAVPVVDGVLPKESYPFEIPDHWKWYPLGKIVEYGKCTQIGSGEISETTWVLDLEDIEKGTGRLVNKKRGTLTTSNKAKFCKGDVLYGKLRPYLNKVLIADEDGVCTTEIVPISVVTAKLPLLAEYLQSYLMSPFFLDYANKISYGVKMPRLGTKDAKAALIPVPPVEEQARIVAKLEEAFSEIDRAEKAYEELQTLAGVLRGQILQEAIQGKLVPQLAEEGVVEQIGATQDEVPFKIPESWKWVKLKSVFSMQAGKFISASSIQPEGRFPCYGGNGLRGYVDISNRKGRFPLIGRQGALCGNVHVVDGEFYATEHAVVVDCGEYGDPDCVGLFLEAMNLNQYATATAQPGLSVKKIIELPFPLPPKDEQARIVSRVKDLMKQVDALSAK